MEPYEIERITAILAVTCMFLAPLFIIFAVLLFFYYGDTTDEPDSFYMMDDNQHTVPHGPPPHHLDDNTSKHLYGAYNSHTNAHSHHASHTHASLSDIHRVTSLPAGGHTPGIIPTRGLVVQLSDHGGASGNLQLNARSIRGGVGMSSSNNDHHSTRSQTPQSYVGMKTS